MKKIKVIVIGVGHDHAMSIYDCVNKNKELFEVVGFSAPKCELELFADRIEKLKKYLKYYDIEEIYNIDNLDAAIIETEEKNLNKYAIKAYEKNLHVHLDKPGSCNYAEFKKMVELAKAKSKVLHFGYMYRYNPEIIKLISDAKAGEYGDIFSVEAQMDCLHTDEKRKWLNRFPGGMLFFLGCHLIDLILSIQGEPSEIIPLSACSNINGINSSDIGMVAFKYKNGLSFAKSCACEIGGFMRRQLVVCGSKKTTEINPLEVLDTEGFQHSKIKVTTYEESQKLNWWNSAPLYDSEKFNRYDGMMESFAKMVTGEKQNSYSYDYELLLYKTILQSCGVKIN